MLDINKLIKPYDPILLELSGKTDIPMGSGRIVAEKATGNEKADGRSTVLVSSDITQKYGALSVGPAKRGEEITPFGTNHAVKIRDLVSGTSMPKVLRDTVTVVRAGGVPIWIPGLRSSEYLRIADNESGLADSGNTLFLRFKDGIGWY